jgi:molybdopterin synthase catalytic subunit
MTFRISTVPLDPPALARELLDLRAGAYVEFQGWVRNHNEGQPVEALEYESYVALAEKEGARILAEVAARTTILGAACVHRTGLLQLGELAVWVGVTAAHRGDAFDACRAIIDETKARVPIWKKEHYTSGATGWINCATRGDFAEPAAVRPPATP